MSELKVTLEQATVEVGAWLDHKKLSPKQRENLADQIEALQVAVSIGELVINEDQSIKQVLKFPIGNEGQIKEFVYKPRLSLKQLRPYLNGVKANDTDGRIDAYAAALTSQPKSIIGELDTADASLMQNIVVFFL